MKVYIPTLKFVDSSKNIIYNVHNYSFSASELSALEMNVDLLESIWKSFGDTCIRCNGNNVSYQMFVEPIKEQRSFMGTKLDFLKTYGVEVVDGWVLPISKGCQFLDIK